MESERQTGSLERQLPSGPPHTVIASIFDIFWSLLSPGDADDKRASGGEHRFTHNAASEGITTQAIVESVCVGLTFSYCC